MKVIEYIDNKSLFELLNHNVKLQSLYEYFGDTEISSWFKKSYERFKPTEWQPKMYSVKILRNGNDKNSRNYGIFIDYIDIKKTEYNKILDKW